VLTSLLPGIRQLRAPFVAGVLTLTALFLMCGGLIATLTQPGVASPALQRVLQLLGLKGQLVVGSILAYLIGTFVVGLTTYPLQLLNLRFLRSGWFWRTLEKPNLVSWFFAPFTKASMDRLDMRCSSDRELLTTVCEEIVKSKGERLLVKNRDLYVEYDRTLSEVDLRAALLGPGVLLLIGVELNLAWPSWAKTTTGVLAFGILIATFLHSRVLEKLGHSMYAHAVADRLVSTPSLDALEAQCSSNARRRRPVRIPVRLA
jgi:hypothetical protein